MDQQQQDQENNNVAPRGLAARLFNKRHESRPWLSDAHDKPKPKVGPAPSVSPKNGVSPKGGAAWGNWRKQTDAMVEAIPALPIGDEESATISRSTAELGEEQEPVPTSSPSSISPILQSESTPATITPKPVSHKKKHKHNKHHSKKHKASATRNEPTLLSLPEDDPFNNNDVEEENSELLAIDFDRDGDALKEAIADDTLAMWEEQGLYQDMPDLRNEILKGIVENKFLALQDEQAKILEQKQLAKMPQLARASDMSIIAEETEEEDDSSSSSSSDEEQGQEQYNEQDNEEDDGELEDMEDSMNPQERLAFHAFQVQEELELRLRRIDTSEEQCVEASGRLGNLNPAETNVAIKDYHAFNKFKLHDAVEERVAKIFTEDHHVITRTSFDQDDEEDDMDVSSSSVPIALPSQQEKKAPNKRQLRENLHSSFSTFDALLQSKPPPSAVVENEDEWTECEVTVADPKADMKKLVADMDAKLKLVVKDKHPVDEEEGSFMEYTIKDDSESQTESNTEVDVDELSEQREKDKNVALPRVKRPGAKKPIARVHSADSSYLEMTVVEDENDAELDIKKSDSMITATSSADGKTPVAQATHNDMGQAFPTITTTTNYVDDDDMTQITFDHTVDGGTSVTQDHYHATAYLNKNNNRNNARTKSHSPTSPHRKGASGVDSQQTDPSTVLMDDTSFSNRGEASLDSNSRKDAMALSKSVAKILRVEIWSPKVKVVQSAMERLAQAASQGSYQRSNINRLGGVIAILRAMQSHAVHLDIQRSACQALAHLSLDQDTQVAIAEVGGTRAIVTAMESHPEDKKVQEAACAALANITCPRGDDGSAPGMSDSEEDDEDGPSGGHSGVVQVLVATMNKHAQDAAIQAKAFGALANLCLDDQGRLRELSETGGLTAMTLALQKPWENKMDQHEAISTLSILLRSLAELGSSNC